MAIQIEISKDVLVRDLQGEAVILDLKSQRYFGLDEVGMVTWELLTRHQDLETVKMKMLEEFDVEPSRLQADLEVFLERLEEAELIVIHGRPPADAPRGGDLAAQTT